MKKSKKENQAKAVYGLYDFSGKIMLSSHFCI